MFTPKSRQQGNSSTSTRLGQEGQTFFEFILLLLIVVGISAIMMNGFRRGIGGYWRGAAFLLCVHGNTATDARSSCDNINN